MFLLSNCNDNGIDCRAVTPQRTSREYRRDLRKKGGREMVRISVEVKSGSAPSSVMVQAESIERALEIAKSNNPGKECWVTFPLDPETFFLEDSVAEAEESAA
jgi:hypothetical protein